MPDMAEQLLSFNRALALDRVGGDEALLREVVQLFLQEYPDLLEEIRKAVGNQDATRVMETAHTMKGSLSTLGAESGARSALQLESMGRRQMLDGSAEAFQALEQNLALLREQLQPLGA